MTLLESAQLYKKWYMKCMVQAWCSTTAQPPLIYFPLSFSSCLLTECQMVSSTSPLSFLTPVVATRRCSRR